MQSEKWMHGISCPVFNYHFNVILAEYDECATDHHGCDHICVNTLGSFKCECKIGYELHSDGKKCEGKSVSETPIIITFLNCTNTSVWGALSLSDFHVDLYCRCLWRVHWSSQWDHTEPLLPWLVSPQQELCLADSGPWPVSHHPQLLPLWHGGQQCMYSTIYNSGFSTSNILYIYVGMFLCVFWWSLLLMILLATPMVIFFPKLISIVKPFILDR